MLGSAAVVVSAPHQTNASTVDDGGFAYEVRRTEEQWRAMLTDEEYRILREGGTEERKSSPLWEEDRAGLYRCRGCELPVYESEWKTILDIGWVFFLHSIPDSILTGIDGVPSRYNENGMDVSGVSLIEAHCRRCGSHLGHVVYVEQTIRHCINGTALTFHPT